MATCGWLCRGPPVPRSLSGDVFVEEAAFKPAEAGLPGDEANRALGSPSRGSGSSAARGSTWRCWGATPVHSSDNAALASGGMLVPFFDCVTPAAPMRSSAACGDSAPHAAARSRIGPCGSARSPGGSLPWVLWERAAPGGDEGLASRAEEVEGRPACCSSSESGSTAKIEAAVMGAAAVCTGLQETGPDGAGLGGTGLQGPGPDRARLGGTGLDEAGLGGTGLGGTGLQVTGPDGAVEGEVMLSTEGRAGGRMVARSWNQSRSGSTSRATSSPSIAWPCASLPCADQQACQLRGAAVPLERNVL